MQEIFSNKLNVRQVEEIIRLRSHPKQKSTNRPGPILKTEADYQKAFLDDLTNQIYPACKEWNQLSADVRHKIVLMLDTLRKDTAEFMGLLGPTSGNILQKLLEVKNAIDDVLHFFRTLDGWAASVMKRAEEQQLKKIGKLVKKAEADRAFRTKPEPGQTSLSEVTNIVLS